jgi:hypothetical protein
VLVATVTLLEPIAAPVAVSWLGDNWRAVSWLAGNFTVVSRLAVNRP